MTFGILLGTTALLVAAAVALSIGQAWAMSGERRPFRHALVWAVATVTLPAIYTLLGGAWDWPIAAALLALGAPAGLSAVALVVGARRDRADGLAAKPWARRVLGLTGVHVIVVSLGGALALVILLFAALSGIH